MADEKKLPDEVTNAIALFENAIREYARSNSAMSAQHVTAARESLRKAIADAMPGLAAPAPQK